MLSPRSLAIRFAAVGALMLGGLAGVQAAPLPPVAAGSLQQEGLASTIQWGPGYGYYGPRRHYWGGPRYRPYYARPYWGPRCRIVRRWDPYWGGWRRIRRCW